MLIANPAAVGELVAPGSVWRAWSFEPGVVFPLAIVVGLYLRAAITARRHGGPRALPGRTALLFAGGCLALAIALISPLDRVGETLFAAHMAQHLVLIVIAAPLLVLGAPPTVWLWLFPAHQRRAFGQWWNHAPAARRAIGWLTNPPVVLVAQTAALWFWHFPRPYQAALASDSLHALEHISFLGTAVLFWWVTLHPFGRRTLGYGASLIYLGITLCESGALGALLMFSATPWYTVHAAGARLWGLSPLDDQQLAGLIMWIPAGAVYVAAAAALFMKWMAADERLARGELMRDPVWSIGGSR